MAERFIGVASTEVEPVSGTSAVSGTRWAPAGTVHAVQGRATLTVCGASASRYYRFPGHDFELLTDQERCLACLKKLRL